MEDCVVSGRPTLTVDHIRYLLAFGDVLRAEIRANLFSSLIPAAGANNTTTGGGWANQPATVVDTTASWVR